MEQSLVDPRPTVLLAHLDADPLPADPRPGTRDLARTALGVLDIELTSCHPSGVVARMSVRGAGDAGRLLVLAETLASTAAGLAAGSGRRAFGAELDAALLRRPAPGMTVGAAWPLLVERDHQSWGVRIVDATGAMLLEGRCTLMVVDAQRA